MDWLGGVATPDVADPTANTRSVQIDGIIEAAFPRAVAQWSVAARYFAHNSPTGSTMAYRVQQSGFVRGYTLLRLKPRAEPIERLCQGFERIGEPPLLRPADADAAGTTPLHHSEG